ncbi:trypsin-like serine peptidase [Streptomyces sp. AM8-1-1]|uniref:trypsin-like serine peptidase n=1 Tax=Streptomyces sp. AM8-1-1 TaxID=3075825 RepID=UPI0028C4BCBF|nr:trypsin-like serine protease [Streptomyces sp. AM8-1-1]WNO70147.1 trypsin-like serine protease [Streptomyces sp. AM8-1-1]WNO76969.1 trypsin-like serine protease [Streptomyces sp. AM8-1-1]
MHIRKTLAVLVSGLALAVLPLPQAHAEPAPPPTPVPAAGDNDARGFTPADADAYWTPERMRAAQPVEGGKSNGGPAPRGLAASPSKQFEGIPIVGTFFFSDGTDTGRFCGGTVVSSPGKNLAMSAGHCFDDQDARKNLTFVPQYDNGKKPFGAFTVKPGRIYVDSRYLAQGPDAAADLDFNFLQLEPRGGKNIQDVVGAAELQINAGYEHKPVRLIGYPNVLQRPLDCTDKTVRYNSTDAKIPGSFLRIECKAYSGGASGGPFLVKKGNGWGLIGVIGGWHTGGNVDDVSYSSYLDADAKKLYDDAVNNRPPAGRGVLGSASTWQHAEVLAGGYFTQSNAGGFDYSDLVVRWSDGELTLYRGAGEDEDNFDKEIRLAGPGGIWSHAESIAAGDFTGEDTDDLMVRWTDGELTLYPDVDEQGFHGEHQIQPPNALWKHAVSITAGRYTTGSKWTDDLLVRWTDGEVSLYTDMNKDGFHGEKKLAAGNSVWKHATSIAAGDFTGNDQWDLMVRWKDGELTIYKDIDQTGLHGEVQVKKPNDLWTHATVIAAGDYTENDHPDDFIVRWSDGEVSLYPDADEAGLSREITLVYPPA